MKTSFEIAVHLFCDCEDKISQFIYRTGGEAKLKVRVKYIKQEVSKGEFLTLLLPASFTIKNVASNYTGPSNHSNTFYKRD